MEFLRDISFPSVEFCEMKQLSDVVNSISLKNCPIGLLPFPNIKNTPELRSYRSCSLLKRSAVCQQKTRLFSLGSFQTSETLVIGYPFTPKIVDGLKFLRTGLGILTLLVISKWIQKRDKLL